MQIYAAQHTTALHLPSSPGPGSVPVSRQDAAESERLKQIADRLQEIGSDDAEPRATKILRGAAGAATAWGDSWDSWEG